MTWYVIIRQTIMQTMISIQAEKVSDEKSMNFKERTEISKLFKVNKISIATVQCHYVLSEHFLRL